MVTITCKVAPELNSRLEHLVEVTARNKSHFIREAIETYLQDREDYLIALVRLEKKGPRVTLEKLEEELDLAD